MPRGSPADKVRVLFLSSAENPGADTFIHTLIMRSLNRARRLIETVQGQLADRFGMKKTTARDPWHLQNRVHRKGLSHTVAYWLCTQMGESPLQFERLLAA